MPDDTELLRRYADSRSEEAFAQFVERNLSLVYFAALRRTNGDVHLAEDVAQQVFSSLAQEAHSIARHAVPVGWLYVATRNAAANLMRTERRRRTREYEAATMQDTSSDAGSTPDWEKLHPQLDAVMDTLGEQDRNAILLRCQQGRSFAEIGKTLRTSEDAARKRVDRALEKLRGLLANRGITSTSAALAAVLSSQTGMAAPMGLAARVSGEALSVIGPGTGAHLVTFMSTTKVSIAVAIAMAVAAGGFLHVQHRNQVQLQHEVAGLRLAISRQNAQQTPSSVQPVVATGMTRPVQRAGNAQGNLSSEPRGISAATSSSPSLTGGMVPVARWTNRGTATPLTALESYLWAVDQVDVGVTGGTIGFGQWQAKVDAFYATLPDDIRAEYDTPEKLWAELLTGAPHGPSIVSYGVVSQAPDPTQPGQSVILQVIAENQNGVTTEGNMSFELTADGWRRILPDNLIAPVFDFLKQPANSK